MTRDKSRRKSRTEEAVETAHRALTETSPTGALNALQYGSLGLLPADLRTSLYDHLSQVFALAASMERRQKQGRESAQ